MLRRTCIAAGNKLTVPVNPKVPFLVHTAGKTLPSIPTEVSFDDTKPVAWFRFMTQMRRMEQNSDIAYKEKLIRGFLHLYTGQEAIPTGMAEVLQADDAIITAYRDHVWHCVRGGTPYEVFAEMFGKQTGASKGKGGSMHMYKVDHHFYGGNGIVGAQVPLGAGLAWTFAIKNGVKSPKNISVSLYGDGAANQGQIFESFNMAALWKLPALFCCENNHYGMGTAEARAAANTHFHARCEYIPGVRCDGNDIFAVMATTQFAREYLVSGNGPMIVEFDTYRYAGHSMSDPGVGYRTTDEVKQMRETRDTLAMLQRFILANNLATEDELKALTKQANREVDDALEKAKAAPDTFDAELYSDVVTNPRKYHADVRTCQGTKFYTMPDH
jgi:pyruvate dehydrogenase E1 component alpha subunit